MGKTSREIISKLEADGWRLDSVTGSHHHFTRPTRDIKIGTLKSIERQSGIKLR